MTIDSANRVHRDQPGPNRVPDPPVTTGSTGSTGVQEDPVTGDPVPRINRTSTGQRRPAPQITPSTLRPACGDDGLSWSVVMPSGILIGLLQAGRVELEDFAVYALFLERTRGGELAFISAAEVGRLLGMAPQEARNSMYRLREAVLLLDVDPGVWHLYNPAVFDPDERWHDTSAVVALTEDPDQIEDVFEARRSQNRALMQREQGFFPDYASADDYVENWQDGQTSTTRRVHR